MKFKIFGANRKKAHIKTLFTIIRDALNQDDENKVHFACGYASALYNEGHIDDMDLKLVSTIIAYVDEYFGKDFKRGEVEDFLKKRNEMIDKAEEVLLV